MRRAGVRKACAIASTLALLVSPHAARAEGARFVEAGTTIGYGFPAGNLERGSRTSDVTFGVPFVGVDAAYRLNHASSLGAAFAYGVAIPTLCATASDCTSSLGHDEEVSLLARFHIEPLGRFAPVLEARVGYEWFESSLSDKGATASRSYHGLAAALAADAMFVVSSRIQLGARLELRGGAFRRTTLVASGIEETRATEGTSLHLWPTLGARATATF